MNVLLFVFITSILGALICIMPEIKINNYLRIILNFIILICIMFSFIKFTEKNTEIQCLKGKFNYKQVIKYESKTIKDSIGNDKIIYLPVDTTYVKK